jgi:Mn2+/Fe2+ NRAMP family transporter
LLLDCLLIVGVILVILSPIIATLIQLAISRKREFLADASAVLLTRYPEGLAGSASYAIAEAAGWKSGLYRKLADAHGFYGIITLATLVGLLVNFIGIPPFKMLYYTAVLNGVVAPPLMILILLIANNKRIMGTNTNSRLSNIFGVIITGIMSLAGIALLVSYFIG